MQKERTYGKGNVDNNCILGMLIKIHMSNQVTILTIRLKIIIILLNKIIMVKLKYKSNDYVEVHRLEILVEDDAYNLSKLF